MSAPTRFATQIVGSYYKPQWLADQPALHYPTGADAHWDARVMGWLNAVRARVRQGVLCPQQQRDLCAVLDEMRKGKIVGRVVLKLA